MSNHITFSCVLVFSSIFLVLDYDYPPHIALALWNWIDDDDATLSFKCKHGKRMNEKLLSAQHYTQTACNAIVCEWEEKVSEGDCHKCTRYI